LGAKRGGTSGQGASRAAASRPGVLLGILVALSVSLLSITPSVGGATGSSWGAAELIETDNAGNASAAQVAVDASGNAIAVWDQSDGTRNNIWANRYAAESGWGTAQLIETDNAGSAYFSRVAIDASGNAVAVWHQSDGTRYNTWANRYAAGSGWGTAQLIETDNAGDAGFPQVAVDASGNAVAVWQQWDGSRTNIWANRYAVGSGWGTPELIETDNAGDAAFPQVAVDASGNAVAVWHQSDGTHSNIWANRYAAGSGWGMAQLIETDNAGNAYSPQVAVDASGNAVAVWHQSDGTHSNIWANRYAAGSGWGTAQLIETDNAGNARDPQVAVDPTGNAVAVWRQSDGTRLNIWANRYIAPDVAPPVPDAGSDFEAVGGELVWFNGTATDDDPDFPTGATFLWSFNYNGTLVELVGPSVNFVFWAAGVFDVTLTVADASGNSRSDVVSVTVVPPEREPPAVDAGPDQTAVTGESMRFAGEAADNDLTFPSGATWRWTVDVAGTTIVLEGQERTYSFAESGVYTVTLSVSDYWGNIGEDTLVITVVEPDTEAPLVPQPPDIEALLGEPVTFHANATDNSADFDLTGNMTWRFTGGGERVTLYGQTVTYTFDRTGVFAVTLAVLDGSGNRAPVRTFIVRVRAPDVTPPEVTASADRTDVTVGTRVALAGSATDAGVGLIDDALFEWRFTYDGSVKTLAGRSASFVFERAGTYVVELAVRDAAGNVGTAGVTVTVREALPAAVGSGVDALLVGGLLAAAVGAVVALVVLRARKRARGKFPGASDARRTPRGGSGRPSQPRRVAARSLEVRSADERKTGDERGRPPGRV
jgi:hypothetical protein